MESVGVRNLQINNKMEVIMNKVKMARNVLLLFVCLVLAGCSTPLPDVGMAPIGNAPEGLLAQIGQLAPVPADMARIIVRRKTQMLGSASHHVVVDSGPGNAKDVVLVPLNEFPFNSGNFTDAAVVCERKAWPLKGFMYERELKEQDGNADNPVAHIILAGAPNVKQSFPRGYRVPPNWTLTEPPPGEPLHWLYIGPRREANAQLVPGLLKPGVQLQWERLPGTVKINLVSIAQLLTVGGQRVVALPFDVEAGQTYVVECDHVRSQFRVYRL